jgi:hypothetical protein
VKVFYGESMRIHETDFTMEDSHLAQREEEHEGSGRKQYHHRGQHYQSPPGEEASGTGSGGEGYCEEEGFPVPTVWGMIENTKNIIDLIKWWGKMVIRDKYIVKSHFGNMHLFFGNNGDYQIKMA